MSDLEFTDEEIVMALEYCAGDKCNTNCPLSPFPDIPCDCILMAQATSIIKCQKVKIEGLESNLKFVRGTNRRLIENESIVRAEAIKEFAKKIKTDAERICDDNYIEGALIKYVDTLVKEMTETK